MRAAKVFERIRFIADGSNLPAEVDHRDMANEAGRHLCGIHQWRALSNRRVILDVIGGQDYIELPIDFQAEIDIRVQDFATNYIRPGTATEQNKLDQIGTGIYTLSSTVTTRVLTDTDGRERVANVLTIAPTPTSDALQSILYAYQAGWVDLTDDNSYVHLPDFMLPLYLEVAGEYALGVINREQMTLSDRMARIIAGPLFMQAKRVDRGMQSSVGKLRNGIGARVSSEVVWDPSWAEVDFI